MVNKKVFMEKTLLNLEVLTVNVYGAGGTGSHLVERLGAISHALRVTSGRSLDVVVYDFDIVSDSNVARSKFLLGDPGFTKTQIAVSRVNLGYGVNWRTANPVSNIIRTANFNFLCTDDTKSRLEYFKVLKCLFRDEHRDQKPYYIFDIGNDRDFGQIVMLDLEGKLADIDRKSNTSETKGTKSCAVDNPFLLQDLFINDSMALFAAEMFYRFITDFNLEYNQVWINLGMMKIITKLQWK